MPGIGRNDLAGLQIEHPEPDRDKHLLAVIRANLLIHRAQHLGGALVVHGVVLHQDLGNHHKQRGRDALAGNIRHNKAKMRIVDQEEIVEIAADLLGRGHRGIDVKFRAFREGREDVGQHVRLNLRGKGQFRADALFLLRDGNDFRDVFLRPFIQRVKRLRQDLDFVPCAVGLVHRKSGLAVFQRIDPLREQLQRLDHMA